ncbi:hypothetical protein [Brucella anthropi]|uniref:Uncharacterized protein n=1 Tax=Brucella anthropi TaxID=529 RepID=A0A6L3YYB6_BRUAN|nr:hypothetical protein [Brucella anthropi]KAB2758246.1 hypothetical protein F9L04_24840 [Brucella anthropi]UVV66684.1 trafficking protein particle complex II-specific subunit 120 [Brucella anthropi]
MTREHANGEVLPQGTVFYDLSNSISEVRALADTLLHIDMNDEDLFRRASPYLIRILADKAGELDKAHDEFELEWMRCRIRPS